MESKIELIEIAEGVIIQFVYVPKGYQLKTLVLEEHTTRYLGKLNSFNRIKLLENLKVNNGCLVTAFTNLLKSKGWDFEKFPNPAASVSYRNIPQL